VVGSCFFVDIAPATHLLRLFHPRLLRVIVTSIAQRWVSNQVERRAGLETKTAMN
jgi:hypothetical protein